VGIHIAAPALGVAPDSPLDEAAKDRLSTVYHPAGKITMLPEPVIDQSTLAELHDCPAVSLYLTLAPDTLIILASETRLERIHIAANVRLDVLETTFTEEALSAGTGGYPHRAELDLLWRFAVTLEAGRGKSNGKVENGLPEKVDYNFQVDGLGTPRERITITARKRGSPPDKVVSELMILANSHWGSLFADHGLPALYRVQQAGKVRMSAHPGPHEGLGVAQYAWCSSPIRRYVDLVNQRQLIAHVRGEPAPYGQPAALFEIIRAFELAYDAYSDFQRSLERYWCLRWLQQEQVREVSGRVIRENLVRFDNLPLVVRVPDLQGVAPQTPVCLGIGAIDLLGLDVTCRYRSAEGRLPAPAVANG
jgi:exoribonuclease-2